MSPSWVERWRIGLAPDGAEVLRRRGFGRAAAAPHRVDCTPRPGEPPWTAAIDALAQALEEAGAAGGAFGRETGVVLSNHFARYIVLPWQPELSGPDELEALARLRFGAVFGEAPDGWTLRCSEGGWGRPSLACAVDTALIDALRGALGRRRLRLASVQPLLMAAFNDLRRSLAGDAILAIAEPGRLCLAMLSGGTLDAVSSRRTRADDTAVVEQELATLRPAAGPAAIDLVRIGAAARWPDAGSFAARERAACALAACGAA